MSDQPPVRVATVRSRGVRGRLGALGWSDGPVVTEDALPVRAGGDAAGRRVRAGGFQLAAVALLEVARCGVGRLPALVVRGHGPGIPPRPPGIHWQCRLARPRWAASVVAVAPATRHRPGVQQQAVIHTCPRCELRFERDSEVREHLVVDHRLDPDAVRPHPVPGPAAAPVGQARRRVVVVGNHTLLSDALRDRLRAVAREGPTEVHVVVPVQHDEELEVGFWRGRALAERVVAPEVELVVDVGVADPVALVERSMHGARIDKVLLSTLPTGLSRWLQSDVAGRLQHTLGVPVEVVTAEG